MNTLIVKLAGSLALLGTASAASGCAVVWHDPYPRRRLVARPCPPPPPRVVVHRPVVVRPPCPRPRPRVIVHRPIVVKRCPPRPVTRGRPVVVKPRPRPKPRVIVKRPRRPKPIVHRRKDNHGKDVRGRSGGRGSTVANRGAGKPGRSRRR